LKNKKLVDLQELNREKAKTAALEEEIKNLESENSKQSEFVEQTGTLQIS
jgi:hypothetical protein